MENTTELVRLKRQLDILENLGADYEFMIYEEDIEKESFYRSYKYESGCIDTAPALIACKTILTLMNKMVEKVNEITFISSTLGVTKTISKSGNIKSSAYSEFLTPQQKKLMDDFGKEFNNTISTINKDGSNYTGNDTDINSVNMKLTSVVNKYISDLERSGIDPDVVMKYVREKYGIVLSMHKITPHI